MVVLREVVNFVCWPWKGLVARYFSTIYLQRVKTMEAKCFEARQVKVHSVSRPIG